MLVLMLALLCAGCTLGGSAVAEPDGLAPAWWLDVAGDDIAGPLACVALTPRSLSVLAPSGVRVQLDAEGCAGAVLPWVTASGLTVLEDGEPVEVGESGLEVRAMRPSLRVSLLVLVDLSGSIAASGSLEEVRTTVARLARDLGGAGAADTGPWLEVAVYGFATRSAPLVEIVPFTSCPATLKALDEPGALDPWLPSDPATDLYGSVVQAGQVLTARGLGANPDERGLLVLLSDGRDTVSTTPGAQATAAARALDGAWAIALGDGADVGTLEALSSAGDVEALATWTHVADAVRALVVAERAATSTRFLLGYCSPKGGGEHRITIEATGVDGSPLEVRMPPLRFDATGFAGGCDPKPVSNPCRWGAADEHACGSVDGVPCGTCGSIDRCSTCSDEGACVP